MTRNLTVLALGLLAVSTLTGCTYVDAGHVGVKVYMYGSGKGVSPEVVTAGRTLYNPFTTTIYEFPIYEQNFVWQEKEAIQFNDSTGSRIESDIAIQYSFVESKVPDLFSRLRRDADYIGHTYLRTQVRDKITREAKKLTVVDIFGAQGSEMLDRAKAEINREFAEEGIEVHMLAFASELRVDDRIKEAINAVITATQQAKAAENKVKQVEAEAQQAKAKATGEAESKLIAAQKEAEANEVLTKSLSPELLSYKAMEKWDGKLPTVSSGGAVPFINIDAVKAKGGAR